MPDTSHETKEAAVAAATSADLFEWACGWRKGGIPFSGFEVEDYAKDPIGRTHDSWPIVLVRKSDGQRFEVEVTVEVVALPPLSPATTEA